MSEAERRSQMAAGDGRRSDDRRSRIRQLIVQLYEVVEALNAEFAIERRKFTPDGHMVGSLGEVLAAYAYDLILLPSSTARHDAMTREEPARLVQIKLTGGTRGVSLYSQPEHLIVLQLARGEVRLIYD